MKENDNVLVADTEEDEDTEDEHDDEDEASPVAVTVVDTELNEVSDFDRLSVRLNE